MAGLIVAILIGFATDGLREQNEPNLIRAVVEPAKLIPLLPEPLAGWTAEKAEGSSDDVGGFKITNVHREYLKGDAADAPKASISITDAVASPDYVEATSAEWSKSSETPDGYGKPATIDGNPGREDY